MASIKGVSLKNVKKTVGREGEGFTASIYLNGRRVGEYADYADGAMGDYHFDNKEDEQTVIGLSFQYGKTHPNNFIVDLFRKDPARYKEALKRVREHFPFIPESDLTIESMSYADLGLDCFINDIYTLRDIEIQFKKKVDGEQYTAIGVNEEIGELYIYPKRFTDEMILEDGSTVIYRSLEDFVVT